MTFTTFLLTVLAVVIGNNITVRTFNKCDDAQKFWFDIFNYGFVIVDSTVENYNWNPRKDYNGTETTGLIEKVIARGEWHLHIGKYYVFYIIP